MVWLLVISFWGAIVSGYFKINANPNADYILGFTVVFQIVSIIGLVSKWSTHLTKSEARFIENRN